MSGSGAGQLGDLQLAVLHALGERGEATVADVQSALAGERDVAITTVATILSRMERKQLVVHRRDGRQFVYRPLVSDADVRRDMLTELTERVFEGNVAELVSHLLSDRDLDSGDLARVKALIEARERQLGGTAPLGEGPDVDE